MAKAKGSSAAFRPTQRVRRGKPPQAGGLAGVAFLLVTFLWPRKEKSLAQARRAGETPSRAEPSCPMRRSRIKGLTAGSGIRSNSAMGWAKPCRGQRPRVPCGVAASNASPLAWEFGLAPPGSRTSEYASLFEPTASHHIVNLWGTLTPLTLTLSQRERG